MKEVEITEIQFFDFTFSIEGRELKKATLNWKKINLTIWESLYQVYLKYIDKNEKMKKRKKMFEEKQKHYMEALAKRKEHEKKLLWHIAYTEKASGEKQRLLNAIGMIAHNVKTFNS